MKKFRPSTPLLTNRKTADQLNEMLLVEENESLHQFWVGLKMKDNDEHNPNQSYPANAFS